MFRFITRKILNFKIKNDFNFKNTNKSDYRKWCNQWLDHNVSTIVNSNYISLEVISYFQIRAVSYYESDCLDLTNLSDQKLNFEILDEFVRFELGCWHLCSISFWLKRTAPNRQEEIFQFLFEQFSKTSSVVRKISIEESREIVKNRILLYEKIPLDDNFVHVVIGHLISFPWRVMILEKFTEEIFQVLLHL